MSSFNGLNLFASGPANFTAGPIGTQTILKTELGLAEPGLQALGDHTPVIDVHGRLCADTAQALWAALEALRGQIGVKADLSDDAERTWAGVTLLEVATDGPPLRGRLWSAGYRARFAVI